MATNFKYDLYVDDGLDRACAQELVLCSGSFARGRFEGARFDGLRQEVVLPSGERIGLAAIRREQALAPVVRAIDMAAGKV